MQTEFPQSGIFPRSRMHNSCIFIKMSVGDRKNKHTSFCWLDKYFKPSIHVSSNSHKTFSYRFVSFEKTTPFETETLLPMVYAGNC